MIIWIASYPRSGNTFFRTALYHLYGQRSYSIYNDPLIERLGSEDAVGHQHFDGDLEVLKRSSQIHFIKTHELPHDDSPSIFILRDGRAALVSFARYHLSHVKQDRSAQVPGAMSKHVRDLVRGDVSIKTALYRMRNTLSYVTNPDRQYLDILERLIVNGWGPTGRWSDYVMAWVKHAADVPVHIVRFEDLVEDPVSLVRGAVEAVPSDLRFSSEEIPSFDELHEKWPSFFRRGISDSWRSEMPSELMSLFWQYNGDAMRYFQYADNVSE